MAGLGHDALRAIELQLALGGMSPDTGTAVRLIVLTPGGDLVGTVRLTEADVERLRLAAEAGAEAHAVDAGELVAEAEALLRGGGERS
ncbi:hypothetical protein DT019_03075 [Streptomyces sp. SDr-06]|uniref:hypothetical protein n=1 Tax=Streptomyces sp. SDr-06 TaxID=2267702 RepID=UPI000DE8111E|nr:hypothetical protein [Streptomyces sp. SDr-06]RCH70486.1 hypothetical protein DT019_03075 [Streptomyces sp. SDr-06]